MKITASSETGTFVRDRGGSVYVWLEAPAVGRGGLKVSTTAPSLPSIRFHRYEAGAFDLFVDETLPLPEEIEVYVRRWPWRKVAVRGAGADAAAAPDAATWWHEGRGRGA